MAGLMIGLLFMGPAFGLVVWLRGFASADFELFEGWLLGLLPVGALMTEASRMATAQIYLTARHRSPLRLMRFLEDARSRHSSTTQPTNTR
jgi:hypothetical protein